MNNIKFLSIVFITLIMFSCSKVDLSKPTKSNSYSSKRVSTHLLSEVEVENIGLLHNKAMNYLELNASFFTSNQEGKFAIISNYLSSQGIVRNTYRPINLHHISNINSNDIALYLQSTGLLTANEKVVFEPEALCYEDVNDSPMIEFKRKIRISLGNFRNLKYYKHLLFPIHKGFGFAFFSHKVLRWFTPFALLFSLTIKKHES